MMVHMNTLLYFVSISNYYYHRIEFEIQRIWNEMHLELWWKLNFRRKKKQQLNRDWMDDNETLAERHVTFQEYISSIF